MITRDAPQPVHGDARSKRTAVLALSHASRVKWARWAILLAARRLLRDRWAFLCRSRLPAAAERRRRGAFRQDPEQSADRLGRADGHRRDRHGLWACDRLRLRHRRRRRLDRFRAGELLSDRAAALCDPASLADAAGDPRLRPRAGEQDRFRLQPWHIPGDRQCRRRHAQRQRNLPPRRPFDGRRRGATFCAT